MSLSVRSAGFGAAPGREEDQRLTFDAVYDAHARTVARWAGRLGGPRADIQDLTQEVFLVVNRQLPGFRGASEMSTWLFRITANVVANDRRRRAARRWWTPWEPNAARKLASQEDGPLAQLERRETHAQFYDVLDGLRERHRKVLVLFELEEMPTEAIADFLGQSVGSVRVLLHRARAAFLKEMTRREPSLLKETRLKETR